MRLLALAAVLSSCSLLVGENLGLPTCTSHEECAPLNERAGIDATGCMLYQCSPRNSCELTPRDLDRDGSASSECGGNDCDDADDQRSGQSAEICDGLDNDCDHISDEGVAVLRNSSSVVSSGAFSVDGDSLTFAIGGGIIVRTSNGTTVEVPPWQNESEISLMNPALARGCPFHDGSVVSRGSCSFVDVASAGPFVAATSTLGCAAGQLRLGLIEEVGFVQRGPLARSNVYSGVAEQRGQRCTRNGVNNLDLAALDETALVTWSDASRDQETCSDSPHVGQVLGMVREQGRSGGSEIAWVSASNRGQATSLGLVFGAMPIVSFEGQYVVALSRGDRIELLRIIRAQAAEPLTVDASPQEERMTNALQIESVGQIAAERARNLQLLSGPRLTLAWQNGCQGPVSIAQFDGTSFGDVLHISEGVDAFTLADSPDARWLATRRSQEAKLYVLKADTWQEMGTTLIPSASSLRLSFSQSSPRLWARDSASEHVSGYSLACTL